MRVRVRSEAVEHGLDQLLANARRGDRPAFARFIEATEAEMSAFCARIVGPADRDDAVQETYLALWRALPSFRGDSSARTFLYVIARRTALRIATRSRRWRELAEQAPDPQQPVGVGVAYELADALARLDPDRRMALLLTGVAGLTYEEAAAVCGVPIGTIRSRIARAREQLTRTMIEQEAG